MKKRLLSFVLAVLMIASLLPATALAADIADSGTCGAEGDGSNLTWTLDSDGVLTISGTGKMSDYDVNNAHSTPWNKFDVAAIRISDGVTSIGDSAFSSCFVSSVTIPDSVTSIGAYAFCKCIELRSVEIPDSVTSIGDCAFLNCTSLPSVKIPSNVTSIGDRTFASCWCLKSVEIPDGVTSIGYSAFSDCNTLTNITIPNGVTSIGGWAFDECRSLTDVTLPDSVTSIGDYAFELCSALKSVTIPAGVTSIGDGPFSYCNSLTGIWVSKGNNDYSSDASGVLFDKDMTTLIQCPGSFSGAYTIPDSVTSIGSNAFSACNTLTNITIPDSVTNIGNSAFKLCSALERVTIPAGVTNIGESAFYGCESLTSVTIPAGVTNIGNSAFKFCSALERVTIPAGVTNIGEYAFAGCGSLTSVTIPAGVTSIEDGTFSECTSLIEISIPAGVTSIGWEAFSNCDKLTDVYYTGTEAEWNKIEISRDNDALKNANIHYNPAPHEHSYKAVVTAPTCTAKGYTTHTCACGDSYVDTYVDALGHAWDNGKVTKEPTETETGVKTFTCTRCGETKTETIPKLTHEHSYKAVVTAPTCTEKGYTTHTCSCGDSYVDTYVDALGHAWDNGKVTKEPTETETGVKTFTCTRCGETKTETISATGCPSAGFTDVPGEDNWAHAGIDYCVANGLMSGIGNDLFGPKLTTTRAQIVQILYNLEGEPKVSGKTPFTDLTQDWYQDAILWAYQTGVVAGTSSTTFEPDLPVTREQIAVILMEYVTRVLKLERTWTPADLSAFPDAGSVSDWAKDALADAVGLGLISGASNGGQTYLEPQGSATREQVATILMEFCKNVKK